MSKELKKAERAAHRYDGLGAPMSYRPHVAEMRRQVLGWRNPAPDASPARNPDVTVTMEIGAALSAAAQPVPWVRELEWLSNEQPFTAYTPFCYYRVEPVHDDTGHYWATDICYQGPSFHRSETEEEAKAAAQADFEARIRSALVSHESAKDDRQPDLSISGGTQGAGKSEREPVAYRRARDGHLIDHPRPGYDPLYASAPVGGDAVKATATDLVNFAWSAVVTDCTESAEYLNDLVDKLRVALSASGSQEGGR